MKTYIAVALLFTIPLFITAQSNWDNIVTTENTEVFIDSTKIKIEEGKTFAYIKTVYTTSESRQNYINKIKSVFNKNADKKIKKWHDFSYTITYGIYECTKGRFKILQIEDFDANGQKIIKTQSKADKTPWINIDLETVGDYTLYSICDYKQN